MSHPKIWNFWARFYEKLWVQKLSLKPTRLEVIQQIKTMDNQLVKTKLVDLGCGVGELLGEIQQQPDLQHLEMKGIDYASAMIEKAREKHPDIGFQCLDVETWEEAPNTVDIITCTHSLPYYKHPQKLFKTLYSVLRTDGRLILACASQNTRYDRCCMSLVKLTTGKACYPSHQEVVEWTHAYFEMVDYKRVQRYGFMPSIMVWHLRKRSCDEDSAGSP